MAMWLMTPTNEKSTKFAEAADLIASGPFMMDSWTHNSEMVFVPNPNWSGAKPTLTKYVQTFGGDPEAAVAAYEKGDLDLVRVPGTSSRRVVEDPNLKDQVKDTPALTICLLRLRDLPEPQEVPAEQGHRRRQDPALEQELPDRADRGGRQAGAHRPDLRRSGHRRQRQRHEGHPRLAG